MGNQLDYGFTYFLQCNEFIKIGYSSNPIQRWKTFQTMLPYESRFVDLKYGKREIESNFHSLYQHWRAKGEWFRVEGPLSFLIANLEKVNRLGCFLQNRYDQWWERIELCLRNEIVVCNRCSGPHKIPEAWLDHLVIIQMRFEHFNMIENSSDYEFLIERWMNLEKYKYFWHDARVDICESYRDHRNAK